MEITETAGGTIHDIVERAKNHCGILRVEFLDCAFNGISFRVSRNSNEYDIATIYNLKHKIRRLEAGYRD
jgi:hypothetical protein